MGSGVPPISGLNKTLAHDFGAKPIQILCNKFQNDPFKTSLSYHAHIVGNIW